MNDSIIGNVGDEKISTSTSKALMLSLSVPRIYRVYIPPKDQPEASQEARKKTELAQQAKEGRENLESSRTNNTDTTSDESQSAESANEGPLQAAMAKVASLLACDGSQPKEEELENDNVRVVQLKNERNASETIQEHDVGYVEADEEHGRRASIVEHVITKEEMQMIVKIEPTEEEIASIVHDVDIQLSRAQADSSTNSGLSEGFLGVINSRVKDIARAHLSRDEAVAAIKHYDHLSQLKDANKGDELLQDDQSKSKPNTEIKLGELLRLTVRTLYRENHFYNAPIYTNVQARIVPEAPDVDDWLEVSVMVKQSSIGIILERLERIGVGSSVGTIAIYKAELLKTCDILYDNVLNDNTIPKMTNGKENANAEASNSENTPNDAKSETVRADWTNAACRLRIEQVKEQIEEQAELALDYLVLLAVASMLAGIGLVTDNAVVIVASMLVSRKFPGIYVR